MFTLAGAGTARVVIGLLLLVMHSCGQGVCRYIYCDMLKVYATYRYTYMGGGHIWSLSL